MQIKQESRRAIGVLLVLACASSPGAAQEIPASASIKIPWETVREQLPKDGEIQCKRLDKDVECKPGDGSFGKHPTIEFAFGQEVKLDRKGEKKLKYGLLPKDGFVEFMAGFRLHYPVPELRDNWDGIITGRLSFAIEGGKAQVSVFNVKLRPNLTVAEKAAAGVADFLGILNVNHEIHKLEEQIVKESGKLSEVLNKEIEKFLEANKRLKVIRDNVFVTVKPDGLHLSLFTNQTDTFSLPRRKLEFQPPHTGSGDLDFDGAPNVKVTARLKTDEKQEGVYLHVFMSAKESEPDFTEAAGWSPPVLVYQAKDGWDIQGILGQTHWDLVDQRIPGHDPVEFTTPLGKLTVYADRKGNEAGVWTKVVCEFDQNYQGKIAIQPIAKPRPDTRTINVALPRELNYTPPHVAIPGKKRGDREFDGHGPQIWVSAKASIEGDGSREIHFIVNMTAHETKDDWTAAGGWSGAVRLYTAQPGWKITTISMKVPPGWGNKIQNKGNEVYFENIVDYRGTDHNPRTHETPIGKITTYGDRKGNDVEDYTRVVLMGGTETFQLTLERVK